MQKTPENKIQRKNMKNIERYEKIEVKKNDGKS